MRADPRLMYVVIPKSQLDDAIRQGLRPGEDSRVLTNVPVPVDPDDGRITLGVVRLALPPALQPPFDPSQSSRSRSFPDGVPLTEPLGPWTLRYWSTASSRWNAMARYTPKDTRAWWAALNARKGPNVPALKAMARQGFDVDVMTGGERTGLHVAVANANLDLVDLLLDLGADPYRRTQNGMTALHVAAGITAHGSLPTAVALLDRLIGWGMPVDLPVDGVGRPLASSVAIGTTALWLAAYNDRAVLVKHLLEHGASLDARNAEGTTARAIAQDQGFTDVLKALVDAERDRLTASIGATAPTPASPLVRARL